MKKLLIPFAIAALALFGCAKEATLESKKIEIVDPNPPAEDPDVISFQSYLPAKFTKSTWWSSTNKVNWNVDDAVWITDGTLGAVYTALKGGKDSTLLDHFAGDTLVFVPGTEYRAYFPSEIANYDGVKGAFGLPQQREYSGFDRTFDLPMVAKKVRTVAEGVQKLPQDTLNFKNLCGILCLKVIEKQDLINILKPLDQAYGNGYLVIKRMKIYAAQPVCGPGEITYDDVPAIALAPNSNPIIINVNNQIRATGTASPVYTYLPEGKYTDMYIDFETHMGNEFTAKIKGEVNINRGALTEVEASIIQKPASIAIPQTSNCMMVYTNGIYSFRPTKAETGESIGAVDHAVLLWEQYFPSSTTNEAPATNQILQEVSYNAEKDSLYFTVSEFPAYGGNALVGAADKDGKILWSYHIWLQRTASGVYSVDGGIGMTSYDKAGNYQIMNFSLGSTGIMTSNNGGSTTYTCQPLLYQWGRKDPFLGETRSTSLGRIKVAGTEWTSMSGTASLEEATNNPTVFYASDAPEWCSDPSAATWAGDTKSVTDPCPYGYRVMEAEAFEGDYFLSCVVKDNRGVMFQDPDLLASGSASAVVINYSNSSYIKPSDGSFSASGSTYCWTRTATDGEASMARTFNYASSKWSVIDGNHSNAYPVRCQLIPTLAGPTPSE